jgi:hypothetical protein
MNRCETCQQYKDGFCTREEINEYTNHKGFRPYKNFSCNFFIERGKPLELLEAMTVEEITSYLNERLVKMDQVILIIRKSQAKIFE